MKLQPIALLVLILLVGTVVLNAQNDGKLAPIFAPLPQTTPDPNPPPVSNPTPTQPPTTGNTGNTGTTGGEPSIISGVPSSSVPINDGRLGNFGGDGAVYASSTRGITVYAIDASLRGTPVIAVSAADLQRYIDNPRTTLLASSADDKFRLYSLATGEFQVNVGPDEKGEVRVVVFLLSGQETRRYSFNVCEILNIPKCGQN